MPLKTESMDEPSLNLTSMIDVMMLLIIFFLVGTKFSQYEEQFEINLPTVQQAQPLTALPDELIISVTKDAKYFLGPDELTLPELEARLIDARKNYDEQSVLIRGDGTGFYQSIMDVMSVVYRAKIKHMKLANKPGEGTTP